MTQIKQLDAASPLDPIGPADAQLPSDPLLNPPLSLDIFSTATRYNPYPLYASLRQRGPVHYDARADLWLLLDYDSVKQALTDHQGFSSEASGGGLPSYWFIFMDPPRHSKLRELILQAFTPESLSRLEARIRTLSRELLNEWCERGYMDLAQDFAAPLPLRLIGEMMGVPAANWARFRRWGDATLDLSFVVSASDRAGQALQEYAAVSEEMSDYLTDQIALRYVLPKDDLITRLVQASVDGERLSHDDILGFFQLLLVSGSETSANLISNTLLSLLEHPEQLALLRADPSLLPAAIEETLRYRAPVQAMFRITRSEISLGGETIPAGKLVLPLIGAANRDPAHFEQPDVFDIRRSPNRHIAFGHGIHACLGAQLARLEARIALSELLERLDELALDGSEPWPPRQAFHVHGPHHLPIRFRPSPLRDID